jgi:transcriptional regulator with XRE-family HTH domain
LGYLSQVVHYVRVSKAGRPHDYESFSALLKKLREDKGLTQAELAERLEVPQSFVSKYETGERRLDFVETAQVCKALGLTIERFAAVYSNFSKTERGRSR